MQKTYFLTANVDQEIAGNLRYLNILSSSAGFVRVKGYRADGAIEYISRVNAGDAVEFDTQLAGIVVTTPVDAIVTIYASMQKLVNNGVTVKSAGSVKVTRKRVYGAVKLNSISGQNKQIKIRANKAVDVGGAELKVGGKGWQIAAGEAIELNVAGDVYAKKEGLTFNVGTAAQSFQIIDLGQTSKQGGKVVGENSKVFARLKSGANILVKNGQQSTTFTIKPPYEEFADIPFFAAMMEFIGGYFYIYDEIVREVGGVNVVYAAIFRTADFEQYEKVSLINLTNHGITGRLSAGGWVRIYSDGVNIFVMRNMFGLAHFLYLKENAAPIVKNTEITSITDAIVTPDGVTAIVGQFFHVFDGNLNAAEEVLMGAFNNAEAVDAKTNGTVISLKGRSVGHYNRHGAELAQYTLPSGATGRNNLIKSTDDYFLCASANQVTKVNLISGLIESFTIAEPRPASAMRSVGTILKTENGHAIYEVRDGDDVTGFYISELETVAGSIDSAEVEVLELF